MEKADEKVFIALMKSIDKSLGKIANSLEINFKESTKNEKEIEKCQEKDQNQ